VVTLFGVSIVVFFSTQLLPGNVATSILGNRATPQLVAQLTHQLRLDRPAVDQYGDWLRGVIVHGNFGASLVNDEPVTGSIREPFVNSLILVAISGFWSVVLGTVLGLLAAYRAQRRSDIALSLVMLGFSAMPFFVTGIFLILLLSVGVFHLFPAVSLVAPGASPLSDPASLVLPVLTLTLTLSPYVFRMVRATVAESLQSEYCELALLKGMTRRQVMLRHAVPTAIPSTVQVIGLCLLWLAGGIVVVESLFNYPGIGRRLVDAVSARDVPVIQACVLWLAAFYVVVNLITDILALVAEPRSRTA
jgi:ABC-type dipeptide/oligopeptide/nickel transport systems, permease components